MRLLVYFIFILALTGCATGTYHGPPSDHFDGKRFYNPNYPKRQTTTDILNELASQFVAPESPQLYFCSTPVNPYPPSGKKVKITFVNHSTVLVQTQKLNILLDPIWSDRASPFFLGPKRLAPPGIPFEKLPPIDAVLISHNHYDHLDIPTLIKIQKVYNPIFFVPIGDKSFLNQKGIQNVIEMDWWQKYRIKNGVITFLPAQHWSARWLSDPYKTLWGSYGIEINNKKIYFAGDTGYTSHFKKTAERWGQPDVTLLPIGAYEPRYLVAAHHLNPREALQAHHDLHSKLSIAIHFGTFPLGCASINKPLYDLAKYNHEPNSFIVLGQGCSWTLN